MHAYKLINQTIKDFTIVKCVGKGAWATVFQAIDRKTGQQVAVKAVQNSIVNKTPKIAELINTEIRVLKNCKNENVIGFIESISTKDYVFLVIEFCNGGDLEQYLLKRKRLSEDEATTFLKQMINGFKGLHEVNAMHRDFKTANVLIHNGICKIADLGFAKQLVYKQQQADTILGTCLTMAPQILEGKSYGMEADIYSIGVVYYFMIYGKYPFNGNSDKELLLNIRNKAPSFEGVEITARARDFIEKCLAYDVKKRFSWATLYEHPLIAVEDLSNQYMAASRFDVAKNKEFYKKGMQINGNQIFEKREVIKKDEKEEIFGKQINFKKEEVEEVRKLQMEVEKRAKIELAISNFYEAYLARRNSILFVFKFIHPHIEKLMMVRANHAITMFLMGKKAYLDIKEFLSLLQKKKNITANDLYFEQFVKSKSYVDLIEMIASTRQMVGMQVGIFKDEIQGCSGEVQNEFDIESSWNPDFKALLDDIIGQYWFLLADGLDIMQKEDIKKSLLQVMSALDYYKNAQVINAHEFALKNESINFKKEEDRIRTHIASIYQ